jgi:hypothetical protein
MIEGLEDDDRYRMVEDEFVAVAGIFTAHLHAAEYHRLKEKARAQNADTIRSISRPVTRQPTTDVKKKQEMLGLYAKQKLALSNTLRKRKGLSESDDEEPWLGTALEDLMTRTPKKPSISLTSLMPDSSHARNTAAFRDIPTINQRQPATPLARARTATIPRPRPAVVETPARRASTFPSQPTSAPPVVSKEPSYHWDDEDFSDDAFEIIRKARKEEKRTKRMSLR